MAPAAVVLCLATVGAGCQVLLGIDPDQKLLDGGAAGAGGGVRSCTDGDAILCDDFEDATIDAAIWPHVDQISATTLVDTEHPHQGHRSLHAHTDAASQADTASVSAMVEHIDELPAHFFVRFFVYVASPAPEAPLPEILVNLQKQNGGGMQLYVQNGVLAFTSWANSPILDIPTDTTFTRDAWHCIEWEIERDAPRMDVWLDDEAISKLGKAKVTMPVYDDLKFGLAFGTPLPAEAHDAWIDDVRVATTRVGCH